MYPKESFSASNRHNSTSRPVASSVLLLGSIPQLFIRLGIAFAFLYPPVAALLEPNSWIGYFPSFLIGIVPDSVLLHSFGLLEVIVGLWILSGKNIFIPSALATLMLVGIVAFDLNSFDVIFRDVSIALASLALVFASRENSNVNSPL